MATAGWPDDIDHRQLKEWERLLALFPVVCKLGARQRALIPVPAQAPPGRRRGVTATLGMRRTQFRCARMRWH